MGMEAGASAIADAKYSQWPRDAKRKFASGSLEFPGGIPSCRRSFRRYFSIPRARSTVRAAGENMLASSKMWWSLSRQKQVFGHVSRGRSSISPSVSGRRLRTILRAPYSRPSEVPKVGRNNRPGRHRHVVDLHKLGNAREKQGVRIDGAVHLVTT